MAIYQMEISPSNFKFIRNFRKKIILANSSKPKQAIKDIKEYRLNKINFLNHWLS